MTETVAWLACAEFGDDAPLRAPAEVPAVTAFQRMASSPHRLTADGRAADRVLALAAGDYGHLNTKRPSGEETVFATSPGLAVTAIRTGRTGTGR